MDPDRKGQTVLAKPEGNQEFLGKHFARMHGLEERCFYHVADLSILM